MKPGRRGPTREISCDPVGLTTPIWRPSQHFSSWILPQTPSLKRQRKPGEDPAGRRQAGLCVRPCTQACSSRPLLTLLSATPEHWALGKLFSLKPSGQRLRSAGPLLNARGRGTCPRPTASRYGSQAGSGSCYHTLPPLSPHPAGTQDPSWFCRTGRSSPPTPSSPARNQRGSHGPHKPLPGETLTSWEKV